MNISRKDVLSNAMKICSSQEKCKFEIRNKIKQWGYEGNDVEEILEELVKEKFIDESRYSRFFCNDKYKFNKWGRVKIRYELSQKRIPTNIIDSAIESINDEEYIEILEELILGKLRSVKSSNKFERNSKLIRFAQGKGFEYELVKDILDGID